MSDEQTTPPPADQPLVHATTTKGTEIDVVQRPDGWFLEPTDNKRLRIDLDGAAAFCAAHPHITVTPKTDAFGNAYQKAVRTAQQPPTEAS